MSTATPDLPARRAAAYDRVIDDLTYRYSDTFTRNQVQAADDAGRAALEPVSAVPDFLPVLVERFAKDQLLAPAQASGHAAKPVPELLFVCVHNAGRSQMAAALAQHLSAGRVHLRSAGSAPRGGILPTAVQALAERGIDVSEEFPKPLTDEVVHAAEVIVTMGCGDECPYVPGNGTRTGTSTTRTGSRSRSCVPFVTTSRLASRACWPRSSTRSADRPPWTT